MSEFKEESEPSLEGSEYWDERAIDFATGIVSFEDFLKDLETKGPKVFVDAHEAINRLGEVLSNGPDHERDELYERLNIDASQPGPAAERIQGMINTLRNLMRKRLGI